MVEDKKIYSGKIIFFDPKKGYGFILWDKDDVPQKDLFIHFSDISMEGFKTVNKDDQVSFSLGLNVRGDIKAINVLIIK